MLIKPSFPEVKLNLYFDGKIVFESLNQAEALNIRKQIAEQRLEGYYFKVDSIYWHLFKDYDEIHNEVACIDLLGQVETWFSSPFDNCDGLYGETLEQCLGIRRAQRKNENEDIHTETRSGF